ncbi:purine-nucleoside phosphorylase [Gracilimonas mengyeensis]|uniref:Purine nucleoside phosphorylase n=1 Tax=Gracilimonas mengyeensis TaxID=1302730 RepID=A0A521FIX2_9BACT|nr:purine-nucleoside phosphorylase [Gracilimonas mengyeensis]SMO96118.1 purine-nucleoside phosphorylase [Gracilimonas mengyeensis]
MSLPEYIPEIKSFLTEHGFPEQVDAAVILGSGLGSFGDHIENSDTIPYEDIPSFPVSTVEGHSGSLIFGEVGGKSVVAFSGRFHHYEGHDFAKTVLPVQLASVFGVNKLIISNAAGGINLRYHVGDLMIIDSIIKQFMMVSEPAVSTWSSRFEEYALEVKQIARDLGIETQMGTYLYVKGPNYESKAEIKAFRKMGGDAVGMSTAPELIEAAKLDIKTAAISLITNAAAGVTGEKLDHAEVKEAADKKKEVFARLVKGLIQQF